MYSETDNIELVIAAYEKLFKLDCDDINNYYTLAEYLLNNGELKKANAFYKTAADINCIFRSKLTTYSGACWPPIPEQSDHLFRRLNRIKLPEYSGASWPVKNDYSGVSWPLFKW